MQEGNKMNIKSLMLIIKMMLILD